MTRVDGWNRRKKIIISNWLREGKKYLKLAKNEAGSIQGKFIRKAFVPTSFKIISDILKCLLAVVICRFHIIMPDFVVYLFDIIISSQHYDMICWNSICLANLINVDVDALRVLGMLRMLRMLFRFYNLR